MAKIQCCFCGEYYDEEYMGTLDNGSPACPNYIADEDRNAERKAEETQDDEE